MDYREYYADPDHVFLENQYYTAHQILPQRLHRNDPYVMNEESRLTNIRGRAAIKLGTIGTRYIETPTGKEPWIEARFIPLGNGYFRPFVEMSVVQPTRLELGKSALLDAVRLGAGDTYTVNAVKYPELLSEIDGTHLSFHVYQDIPALMGDTPADHVYIDMKDTGHGPNSYVYRYPSRTDAMYGLPPTFFKPPEEEEFHPRDAHLNEFINKYRSLYPTLTMNDFRICLRICDDLRELYSSPDSRSKLIRRYNTMLHPESAQRLPIHEANNIFLLGKQELGI